VGFVSYLALDSHPTGGMTSQHTAYLTSEYAKETYVLSKEPYSILDYSILDIRICSFAYSDVKYAVCCEPYVPSKEPYDLSKEPYSIIRICNIHTELFC